MIKHRHHIIPRHATNGVYDNSPSNLTPPISVELHAAMHRDLFEHFGRWQDYVAWKTLCGQSLSEVMLSPAYLHRARGNKYALGCKRSQETRDLIRQKALGHKRRLGCKHSPETLEKLRRAGRARRMTPESNEKRRQAATGRRHRPESIEKMRLAKLGRAVSAETCEKLRQSHLGCKPSPETRAKISLKNLGNQHFLGHKHSPETKEKMRQSHLRLSAEIHIRIPQQGA